MPIGWESCQKLNILRRKYAPCYWVGFVILLLVGTFYAPNVPIARAAEDYSLQIPALDVQVPVINLRRTRTSWSVARLNAKNAGHLEGTRNPGEGGNVVIVAHVETYAQMPGPFFKLNQLKMGDEIQVDYRGAQYFYTAKQAYTVKPEDITPVQATDSEVLTLITCAPDDSDLPKGRYALRLIVRAELSKIFRPGANIQ